MGCGGFASKSGMASHYARYSLKIDPKELDRFSNVGELKKKCEDLMASEPEWLTESKKEIIKIFLAGFSKKKPWEID